MNCIIIEDQHPAQRILKKYINDFGGINLVGIFEDALKSKETLQSERIDLIFLDIHLPKISGIEFLKTLRNPPHVILTTAFPDFALESYELNVTDYLLKPFSFKRFIQAIDKVIDKVNAEQGKESLTKSIFIKSGYDYVKVTLEDIVYIKSDGDYTDVHMRDKMLLSSETLKYWIEEYNQELIRVHRSYVVNKNHILQLSKSFIILTGDINIPIGRAYKDAISQIV